MKNKLLVVQVAALGYELLKRNNISKIENLDILELEGIFPALTCPVQATMRTGLYPAKHGVISNGYYSHELKRPLFWEQSSAIVEGKRIWEEFRKSGKKVGMLFWQQSLGEDVEILLSPWPIHKHGGGLVDSVYSKPENLYNEICRTVKRPFKLHSFWGPFAGIRSTRWISSATEEIMAQKEGPNLLLTYLPHLDYALQKYPSESPQEGKSLEELLQELIKLIRAAFGYGYELVIYGDYAIADTRRVYYPNRLLKQLGHFKARDVNGKYYPNFYESEAYAIVDHQICHIYVNNKEKIGEITTLLKENYPYCEVLKEKDKIRREINHKRSGDIVIAGTDGSWFAYPWWENKKEAPDYASHIDIHNKPGFDPCELFSTWNPFVVSTDTSKIRGTHGFCSEDGNIAFLTTLNLKPEPKSLIDLSHAIRNWLNEQL